MTYRLITTVSAAAVASGLAFAPAIAQTDSNQSGSNASGSNGSQQAQSGGGKNASDITCAEITAMDTAMVPGVLYYISGYNQAHSESGQGGSGAQASSDGGASSGGSGSDSAGGDASASGGSDSGSGSGSEGGDTAAASGSGDSNMAAEGSTDTASDASGGMSVSGDQMQLTRVAGYFPIPIEQTMIACGEAPERRAGDVLSEQGQNSQ